MLMSMRSINEGTHKTCCKDCMRGQGTGAGRKANRRYVKRADRQVWRSEIRNYS